MRDGAHRGDRACRVAVEDEAELAAVYGRLKDAGAPCWTRVRRPVVPPSPKRVDRRSWRGVGSVLTNGEATVYGDSPDFAPLASDNAAEGACCVPTMPQAAPVKVGCC